MADATNSSSCCGPQVADGVPRLRFGSRLCRQAVSELAGTFLLVSLCLSASANCIVSRHASAGAGSGADDASVLMATLGSGLALAFTVYAASDVSGGHLNPAVSFALLTVGRMPLIEFLVYQAAQYIGAFAGAGAVHLFYSPLFDAIDGGRRVAFGVNGTASAFVTLPHPSASLGLALANQIFTSAAFILAVRAVTDKVNAAVPRGLQPLLVGLAATCLLQCTLPVSGCTLNPARDLSPRLLAFLVGYGPGLLEAYGPRAFWAPLLGPYLGALVGTWFYEICFHRQVADIAALVAADAGVTKGGGTEDTNGRAAKPTGDRCDDEEEGGVDGERGKLVALEIKDAGTMVKDGKW